MTSAALDAVSRALEHRMAELAGRLRRDLAAGRGTRVLRQRPDGDVTRQFDDEAERALLDVLAASGLPLRVLTEESGALELSGRPEFLAVIDPLDGSTAAAHGIPLCSMAVSLVDLATGRPVVSHVHDVFTDAHYRADAGGATRDGVAVRPRPTTRLDEAFLVSYMASRGRAALWARGAPLFERVAYALNYGGVLDIARVGAGQTDLFVEYAKGFQLHDCVAGLHFAARAGAVCSDLGGRPLDAFDPDRGRVTFIVAATAALRDAALDALAAGMAPGSALG